MDLQDLRNIHAGETVWVLGSGGTLNHLDAKFLIDRFGVGVYSLNPFINLNLEGHVFEGV